MKKVNEIIAICTLAIASNTYAGVHNPKVNYTTTNYKDHVTTLVTNPNSIKYNKSINSVGEIEIENFNVFFDLGNNKNPDVFVNKINELQKKLKIKQDGVLGADTLKKIYLNYYILDINNINFEAKQRLKIYQDLQGYNKIKGARNGKINPFNNEMFYGTNIGINVPGTYINQNLVGLIPNNIKNKQNKIVFSNIGGKTILAFYVNGKLEVATYGTPGKKDGKHNTPKTITTGEKSPEILHFSTEYPEMKIKNGKVISKKGGAVMPYAVNVDGKIWIHGSDGYIDGFPHSHGCIRVGLYYQERILAEVKKHGIQNVLIDTTNIY